MRYYYAMPSTLCQPWYWDPENIIPRSVTCLKLCVERDSVTRSNSRNLPMPLFNSLSSTAAAPIKMIVIVIAMSMFMVLSSWHCHCESSPGSQEPGSRPPTFGPSQSAWASDPPRQAAVVLHSPSPFTTTQPESWYSFYHPTEGRRLSLAGWLRTEMVYLPETSTHPSTNWACCMVTSLIRHNELPLCHDTNHS